MSENRTTARAFHDAAGVEDWRVLFSGAHAYFRVGSFGEAARLMAAIAQVAEALGHFPGVDVRPEGVTVRSASGEYGALSDRDVDLARRISAKARLLGLQADPSQVQVVAIAVAQDAGSDVGPFWAAALGYRSLGPDGDVVDWHRRVLEGLGLKACGLGGLRWDHRAGIAARAEAFEDVIRTVTVSPRRHSPGQRASKAVCHAGHCDQATRRINHGKIAIRQLDTAKTRWPPNGSGQLPFGPIRPIECIGVRQLEVQ